MQKMCNKCQFKSSSKKGLRNHMAFVHREVGPLSVFKCDECPFIGKTKQSFNDHRSMSHMKDETSSQIEGEKEPNESEKIIVNDELETYELDLKCIKCEFVGETELVLSKHNDLVHGIANLENEIPQLEYIGQDNDNQIKTSPKTKLFLYDPNKRPTWNGQVLYGASNLNNSKKYVSRIWKYGGFEQNADSTINREFMRCGECGWKCKYAGGSTSNFIRHLMNFHMIEF